MIMTEKLKINDRMSVAIDDGFHVMDEDERSRWRAIGEDFVALSDPDRHLIVTIGWKEVPALALLILSPRDLAKNMEKTLAVEMKDYGYSLGGYKDRRIAGEKARGVYYSYESEGIAMAAESFVFKKGKTVYYLHLYSRAQYREENEGVWAAILDSVTCE